MAIPAAILAPEHRVDLAVAGVGGGPNEATAVVIAVTAVTAEAFPT